MPLDSPEPYLIAWASMAKMGGGNTASGRGKNMLKNNVRGLCLVILVVVSCAVIADAAYLCNVPVQVKQPDGTILSCLASGDEFYNWLHDKDGYTIMRNAATGFLVYAD